MLMVWWNDISVWTNVHFLEIVWSHRMVGSMHMFSSDDFWIETHDEASTRGCWRSSHDGQSTVLYCVPTNPGPRSFRAWAVRRCHWRRSLNPYLIDLNLTRPLGSRTPTQYLQIPNFLHYHLLEDYGLLMLLLDRDTRRSLRTRVLAIITRRSAHCSLLRTHKPGSPLLPCLGRTTMPLTPVPQPILDWSKSVSSPRFTNPYSISPDPEFLGPGMSFSDTVTLASTGPLKLCACACACAA